MPVLRSLLAGLALVAASGCATLAAPGPDPLPVTSEPAGAQVSVDGTAAGVTPAIVYLPRGGDGVVRVESPGYGPATVYLDRELNGWFWGNFAGPGGLGMLVDLAAGNVTRYPDQELHVELQPAGEDGGEPPSAVATLRRRGPTRVVRDRRRDAVFSLSTGAGFPEIVSVQGGPMLGPISLDGRLGYGILDAYAGIGVTSYVLETPASAYGSHAFVLAGRQMWNLDPQRPSGRDSKPEGDYSFDLELHGPDWQMAGQAGWIYTAPFGMQVRVLGGLCRLEGQNQVLPSADLGMGWVF